MREAEAAVTEARRQLNEGEQGTRLAEADRGHAVRAMENLGQRRMRLEQERAGLNQPDPVQLAQAEEAAARAEDELEARQSRLADLQGRLPNLDAALRNAREALAGAHRRLTETRARYDALQQLQKRVQQSGEIGDWFTTQGLAEAKPLWQVIDVRRRLGNRRRGHPA